MEIILMFFSERKSCLEKWTIFGLKMMHQNIHENYIGIYIKIMVFPKRKLSCEINGSFWVRK